MGGEKLCRGLVFADRRGHCQKRRLTVHTLVDTTSLLRSEGRVKPPTRKPYLTFWRQKPPEGSQPQHEACSHVLILLGGGPLSPHEALQLGKSGKGLLFSRDAPPPQRVSDVVSCGWFPAVWGPSLSPFRGSFSLEGRSFAPSRTGPITHLPPCRMAPS